MDVDEPVSEPSSLDEAAAPDEQTAVAPLSDEELEPENLPLTLVPITVTQPAAAGELLLRHASGWQLAFPAGVDAIWLARLLRRMV